MPGMITTPDFNKNDIQGWNTRLIFSQNIPSNVDLTSHHNYFTNISAAYTRGTLGAFPENYWSQGRMLRLKASFNYTGIGGSKLDINAGLDDGTNAIFGVSDNGNAHNFAGGNPLTNVPINLEITFSRSGTDNGFTISGFYQYEWGSYDSGGDNTKVIYVPINNVYDTILDFTQPTQMILYVEDQSIEVFWLTIEELG